MAKQLNRKPRKLGQALEALENRRLMAGDVDVAYSGGDLYITGDSADNRVLVEEVDGMIRVTGQYRNGYTTLNNGTTSQYQIHKSWVDDIRIDMNGGSDWVQANNLNLNKYSHSDLVIDTDGGEGERVGVYNSYVRRHLDIDTDGGADDVIVSYTDVGGDINVNTGSGRDEVDLYYATAGDDLIIDSGSYMDDVAVQHSWAGDDLFVRLGGGNDILWVNGGQAEDVTVLAEANHDRVTIQNHITFDDMVIDMGSGDDDLYLYSNWVGGSKAFKGGSGSDDLAGSGNNFNPFAHDYSF